MAANTDEEISPLNENNDQPKDSAIDIPDEDLEPGPECCIYKVARRFRARNEEAYTPHLISIGPIHHGDKNLAQMELQKKRYYEKFQQRTSKKTLEDFKSYIEQNIRRIGNCYDVQFTFELGDSRFVDIILYDAVFIIMLFLRHVEKKHGDPNELTRVKLLTDLMLLENQLPFFVLEDLYNRAFPTSDGLSFLNLAYLYFDVRKDPSLKEKKIKHFTDLIRHHALRACPRNACVGNHNMYSATRLHEAGVQFNCHDVMFNGISYNLNTIFGFECEGLDFLCSVPESDAYGLLQVQFEKGVLKLLSIDVEYETEIRFRNLMAFEQYHYPKAAYFCSYIKLLDSLIDTDKDVDLLVKERIIVNRLGSSDAVANMINKLALGVVHSTLLFGEIGMKINQHYKNSWNRRWATLKHVYFNDLWRGTATVAAFIVVILTLIQTVLAILEKAMPTK